MLKKVSGVALIGWEWVADRVEQSWVNGKAEHGASPMAEL